MECAGDGLSEILYFSGGVRKRGAKIFPQKWVYRIHICIVSGNSSNVHFFKSLSFSFLYRGQQACYNTCIPPFTYQFVGLLAPVRVSVWQGHFLYSLSICSIRLMISWWRSMNCLLPIPSHFSSASIMSARSFSVMPSTSNLYDGKPAACAGLAVLAVNLRQGSFQDFSIQLV